MTDPDRARPVHVIRAGFMQLLDCAPLIVAGRMGFAESEGIAIQLMRETSWATLRDRIAVRHLDVAHMVAPMPIADNLGLSPLPVGLISPIALGFGGNTVTVTNALWDELAGHGAPANFDPAATARAFARAVAARHRKNAPRITIGVVHTYSAHHYEVAYWLAWAGLQPGADYELVVVPPSLSAAALAAGQVDGFCAGDPWGSAAVLEGIGRTITTNAHIWRSSPEKVLGVRKSYAEEEPDRLSRLVRAVYRAAVWCDDPKNRPELIGLLSEEGILGQPPPVLAPGISRRLQTPDGGSQDVAQFLTFSGNAATFPWVSHALWMFSQMVRWGQVKLTPEAIAIARSTYRPDLYREALAPLAVPMPSANAKLEGSLSAPTPVASAVGRLVLGPDKFFDGRIFDPDRIEPYVAGFGSGSSAT